MEQHIQWCVVREVAVCRFCYVVCDSKDIGFGGDVALLPVSAVLVW